MTLLHSLPTFFSPPRPLITTCNPFTTCAISTSQAKAKPTFLSSPLHCTTTSSSSSAPVVVDAAAAAADARPPPTEESSSQLPFRGCKTCGKEEIEKGCNGEGRIQGGIATVPGFGWWPIKAYRPCPGFVASGGRYRRQGQSMDEVAFGRSGRETSVERNTEDEARKKRPDPRRFKR